MIELEKAIQEAPQTSRTHRMIRWMGIRAPRASEPFLAWRSLGTDLVIVLLLAAAAGLAVEFGTTRLPVELVYDYAATDTWFDGDLPRVGSVMSERWHRFGDTTQRHPLLPMLTVPIVKAIQAWFMYDSLKAIRVMFAAVAGAWVASLYLALRLLGCHRPDAVLFTLLASISASSLFWFVVPETWVLGSLTILLAILTVAAARRDPRVPRWWHLALQVGTFGVTLTNWMAGILATAITGSTRLMVRVILTAAILVTLLWCAQKVLVPQTEFFHRPMTKEFLFQPGSGGPVQIVSAFLFHGMIMPRIQYTPEPLPEWPELSVQRSRPGSGTPWGAAAVVCWAAMLGLGVRAAVRERAYRRFAIVLGVLLAGQITVHLVFGAHEVFLFSLHWTPLLIILAALGALGRTRPVTLALATVLLICAGINNVQQFQRASSFAHYHASKAALHPAALAGLQPPEDMQ